MLWNGIYSLNKYTVNGDTNNLEITKRIIIAIYAITNSGIA